MDCEKIRKDIAEARRMLDRAEIALCGGNSTSSIRCLKRAEDLAKDARVEQERPSVHSGGVRYFR